MSLPISCLACFRRALAGKRIAPQWVRRTLTCERVDDCQAECALEKRFSCEGFNYRLDPSGQGQGICELIDVPLSEIDIYSSPNRRDENLLFHPDYDYYERDRSACRPSFCKDCGSGSGGGGKPYLPRPDSQPPTKYFPEPPPSSYNDGGHVSEDRDHTPHSGGKPYLPTPPDYNTPPTTYRPIDNFKPYSDSRPHHDSSGGDYHSSDRFQPPYENTAVVSTLFFGNLMCTFPCVSSNECSSIDMDIFRICGESEKNVNIYFFDFSELLIQS